MMNVFSCAIALSTRSTASCAVRLGRYPYDPDWKSASKWLCVLVLPTHSVTHVLRIGAGRSMVTIRSWRNSRPGGLWSQSVAKIGYPADSLCFHPLKSYRLILIQQSGILGVSNGLLICRAQARRRHVNRHFRDRSGESVVPFLVVVGHRGFSVQSNVRSFVS
jgi:hypothetical protein